MQLDNILLTNTIVQSMSCLIIGLFIIKAKAISLRSLQAIYLLLGAAQVALCYVFLPEVDMLIPIAALAAGIILTLIATGIFGKLESSYHYETLLVSVGLFPWYLGINAALTYLAAALVFCAITQLVFSVAGIRAINYPMSFMFKPSKIIQQDKLELYRRKSDKMMTTPIGFAAILSAFAFAINF